ncbi:hypothetical protein, partial [Pontiella sp.]|uniref:hypothetical protein n=1 Tax=Pontiella sp. TaxID=2837462 RepID=UPI00356288B9
AGCFVRYLACALMMGAAAWAVARYSEPLLGTLLPAKFAQLSAVALAVAAGGAAYLLLAIAFKAPELQEITRALKR